MNNKVQLPIVLKFIMDKSSENNPVRKADIMEYLNTRGVAPSKNTLTEILKTITDAGFDLITVTKNRHKCYYIPCENFDMTEARLITDAVVSAAFITHKKTEKLLSKILKLTDREMEVHYMTNIVKSNRQKHSNSSTYYTIDVIQEALKCGKQIRFRYFDLDENKHRVYRHNNKIYEVCPITMMNDRNNYYLIAYDPKTRVGKERTFRIDRIENAALSSREICKIPFDIENCIVRYKSSVFSMYGGRVVMAEFEFDFKTMNIIYDQYGENIRIKKLGEDRYYAKLPIEDSPTFWGWLFMLGERIRILSPRFLIERYDYLLKSLRDYNELSL